MGNICYWGHCRILKWYVCMLRCHIMQELATPRQIWKWNYSLSVMQCGFFLYNFIGFFSFCLAYLKKVSWASLWMHGLYIFLNFSSLSVKKYREKSNVFSFLRVLEDYFFEGTVFLSPFLLLLFCFGFFVWVLWYSTMTKIYGILQKLIWKFVSFFLKVVAYVHCDTPRRNF